MTSIMLARKLASVNLSKGELEKVKSLRVNNMSKILKIVNSLKSIIDDQDRNKTCRLCLSDGEKRIFDVIDQDFDFVSVIKCILGIEVSESDGKPQYICNRCENTLRDVERLKKTAEITQWKLQQELDMVSNTVLECDTDHSSRNHGGFFVEQTQKVIRQWTCAKCRRIFENQDDFREHEKLPSCREPKCFMCETCGLEFKTMTRLKRHRMIHTGELRYECDRCPYRARTKYGLTVHERAHSGARPLACALCAATFPSASNLASHRRTHLPPAYTCHLCQRTFRFNEALQNHIASQHSTAKPHICNSCGKAFSTRKMVCRHERRVHNRPRMRSGITPTYLRQQEQLVT